MEDLSSDSEVVPATLLAAPFSALEDAHEPSPVQNTSDRRGSRRVLRARRSTADSDTSSPHISLEAAVLRWKCRPTTIEIGAHRATTMLTWPPTMMAPHRPSSASFATESCV